MSEIKGRVKKIHGDKGFGFIKGEDGKDYFFHRSALRNSKIDNLEDGDKGTEVTFTPGEGERGPRAEEIYV